MAAGAILPPLFFEQRRGGSILASPHGTLKNILKHTNVDHAIERPARSSPTTRAMTAEG
jgi:hypothetical protein